GDVIQKAEDARPERSPDIHSGTGADTPHTGSLDREPALVGAGAHTADATAHVGANAGDHVIRIGDSLDNNLGDIGRTGDNLPGGNAGNHLPGGGVGNHMPTGHAGDNLPGGHADDLGHGPSASHEPPTGGGHSDGPNGAGHVDEPGGGHGDGPNGGHSGDTPTGDDHTPGGGDHGGTNSDGDSPSTGSHGDDSTPAEEPRPFERGGETEQQIRDQLRGSKVKPGDLDKALANLADHPAGQEMADLIASGRFNGMTNYDQVVSSFTQKDAMSGGVEQLRLAERLQNSGVTDIGFEIKKDIEIKPGVTTGPKTDLDVMARDADGKVYGYQFKDVLTPKKVANKMWQNIGQLADSGADVKVFVVDTKGSVADMLASGIQKDLARIHAERDVIVVLRVEDGTLMYPPGTNFMPGGRP
ncbi:hypothetical protein ACFRCH_35710, partial [Streptomyces sp. NPDC056663]